MLVFLCLTYFTNHNALQVDPWCCKWQHGILFHGWVVFCVIYMHHIFFIHSSVDGHLGCLYILAIVNKAIMNIGVNLYFQIRVFVFFRYIPRSRYISELLIMTVLYTHLAKLLKIELLALLQPVGQLQHSRATAQMIYRYCIWIYDIIVIHIHNVCMNHFAVHLKLT